MHRFPLLVGLLVCALALPACITSRRSADIDRTPQVDTGMGAAILMPGETAPRMPQGGVAPGGVQQTRVGPEGRSGSTTGSGQPSTGNLRMIGSSKIDENRHEVGKEDPLVQKWALAPLGLLAAPFVWGAEKLRGEPAPGPAVPSANKPGPPPPPPVTDYETESLREMERELAERGGAAPPAPTRSARAPRATGSIADELAALEQPAPAPTPRRASPAPRAAPAPRAMPAPRTAPEPLADRPPGQVERADGTVDRNGDGQIDEWIYREDGQLVRKALDRDADGRVDAAFHYDPGTSEVTRVEEDEDGDGAFDAFTEYRGGRVVRRRADADRDGEVDTWTFYAKGRMTRHEQDTTGDGFRDRIGYYSGDHLAREEYDRDGDGEPDVVTHYDAAERITRREEDVDRNGTMDVISHYEGGRLARKEILDNGERETR